MFNELLDSTPRGNFGNVGLYYDAQEILPSLIGDHRYNKANDEISRYSSKEVEVRALIEGQFIAKRAHAEDRGFSIGRFSSLLHFNTKIVQLLKIRRIIFDEISTRLLCYFFRRSKDSNYCDRWSVDQQNNSTSTFRCFCFPGLYFGMLKNTTVSLEHTIFNTIN